MLTLVDIEDLFQETLLKQLSISPFKRAGLYNDLDELLDHLTFAFLHAKLLEPLVAYFWLESFHLEQGLVAGAELVLDLVCSAHASEDTTVNQYTHFGGQSFSFFH